MADPSETNWISYILGALFTAGAGTAAHIHMRINRGEDQRREDLMDALQELREKIAKAELAAQDGDNAIWKDVIAERQNSRLFREGMIRDMATKHDLRDMERRIMDALRGVDRGNAS